MTDPRNLQRFVDAQAPVYPRVCDELRGGCKEGHWTWFIFPQVAGLGSSEMAQRFAISSIDETRAFLEHPILGPRLRECAGLVGQVEGRSARQIFGGVDEMKFRSSMTLFASAAPGKSVFEECLEKFFGGQKDRATLDRL
jgi:uncharacterized protein (DUF1810 family)